MADEKLPTKVTTGKFRSSYANVFVARSIEDGDPMYSITMLFDKDDPCLKDLKKVAKNAVANKWGSNPPKNLRSPFRDPDDDDKHPGEAYKGKIYIRASSKTKPGIVDAHRNAIIDPNEFYSGCYARATLNAFGYDTKGNKGVSFGLNNLQKLGEGERLDGRVAAEDDFDDYNDGNDSGGADDADVGF